MWGGYPDGGNGPVVDNTVVDIESLPTENVDESKIYRTTETISGEANIYIYDGFGEVMSLQDYAVMIGAPANAQFTCYVVQSFVDFDMSSMVPTNMQTFDMHIYICPETGEAYITMDGDSIMDFITEMLYLNRDNYVGVVSDINDKFDREGQYYYFYVRYADKKTIYGIPRIDGRKLYAYDGEWKNLKTLTNVESFPQSKDTECVYITANDQNSAMVSIYDQSWANYVDENDHNKVIAENKTLTNDNAILNVKLNIVAGDESAEDIVSTTFTKYIKMDTKVSSGIGVRISSANTAGFNLTEFKIPKGVTEIAQWTFANWTKLVTIDIPDTVQKIGEMTFYRCGCLESIVIPEGVTSIEPRTFEECSKLTSVSVPSTVRTIGENAFLKCYALTSCDFTSHTTVPTLANSNAFGNITGAYQIRVPDALYDEWITADNWASIASHIVKASDVV